MIHIDSNGVAGCTRCGWRGVPTHRPTPKPKGWRSQVVDRQGDVVPHPWPGEGEMETFCPVCEVVEDYDVRRGLAVDDAGTVRRIEAKVARNDPCPCGSGRKAKRCCYA